MWISNAEQKLKTGVRLHRLEQVQPTFLRFVDSMQHPDCKLIIKPRITLTFKFTGFWFDFECLWDNINKL